MRAATSLDREDRRPPADRLAETVGRLTRESVRRAREEGRARGLSFAQLLLMAGLREMGSVPATRWAGSVGISPSAVTSLLDGLESAGYARRARDPRDRRQVRVSLTPRGVRLAEGLKARSLERFRTVCRGIPPERLRAAEATLSTIVDRFQAAGESPAASRRRVG